MQHESITESMCQHTGSRKPTSATVKEDTLEVINHKTNNDWIMPSSKFPFSSSFLKKTFADYLLTPMSSKMSTSFFLQSKRNEGF